MSDRYYSPDELGKMDKASLELLVDARGLTPAASGADGKPVVADLSAAVEADQIERGLHPALEAVPVQRKPRDYKVVGPHTVLGQDPGKKFTALLSEEQESSLIEAGHIIALKEKS